MSDVVIEVRAERDYPVVIGRGLLGHLPGLLQGSQRVAVIHPAALLATAEAVREDLSDSGYDVTLIEVPDAEDAKSADVAAFCWTVLGTAGFTVAPSSFLSVRCRWRSRGHSSTSPCRMHPHPLSFP